MIRLLFIVPYPELREKVEHVISHHPEKKRLNADIRVMTVEEDVYKRQPGDTGAVLFTLNTPLTGGSLRLPMS